MYDVAQIGKAFLGGQGRIELQGWPSKHVYAKEVNAKRKEQQGESSRRGCVVELVVSLKGLRPMEDPR